MTKYQKMDDVIQTLRDKGYSLDAAYAYAFGALSAIINDKQADQLLSAVKGSAY